MECKKVIVSTTINSPTMAIRSFDSMKDWTLVVVGDKKTPKDYTLKNGIYLSPEEQEGMDEKLSNVIGWNCIQRRNFGFIYAYKNLNADIVATVDDDNIPYGNWGEDLLIGKEVSAYYYKTELDVFDPVGTIIPRIWHRGFPLQLVGKRKKKFFDFISIRPDIQADFWNGDPDLDAVCRMIYPDIYYFDSGKFPMASNKISPFNSQNTFLSREVLKYYFMFPHIGRMDDIWASFVVQALKYKVVYNSPSVLQKRNKHDLTEDMKKEYIGYENNLNLVRDLYKNADNIYNYLPRRSADAYDLYRENFE